MKIPYVDNEYLKSINELINILKENNLYIDEKELQIYGKPLHHCESIVYFHNDNVIKLKNPTTFKSHNNKLVYLLHYILQGIYFPDTKYELMGFTQVENVFRLVLKQKLIESYRGATPEEVDEYMSSHGFKQVKDNKLSYTYKNEVTICDLHPDNVLVGTDGEIYFIDPLFIPNIGIIDIIRNHINETYVIYEIKKLYQICPELKIILNEIGETVISYEKNIEEIPIFNPNKKEENSEDKIRFHMCDPGKVFCRLSDGFIMGDAIDLGINDSINNYEVINYNNK